MKRISKIFALLLTVCVLCGLVTVFVSAATLNATQLESGSTGIVNTKVNDLEASGASLSSSEKTYIKYSTVAEASGNHYFRTELAKADNKYIYLNGTNGGATYVHPEYKYLVFDADFMVDKYRYVDDETKAEVLVSSLPSDLSETELASATLAYPAGGGFGFRANVPAVYWTTVFFITDGTDWYISDSQTYSETATNLIKLEGGINEWNHLTVVMDLHSADKKGNLHVYLNGEFAYTKNATATEDVIKNTDTYFRITKNTTSLFSFGIDNVAVNAYKSDYKSTDTAHGLDNQMAEGVKKGIYFCEDVVFNKNYTFPGASARNYTVANGDSVSKHTVFSDALSAIKDGSVLTTANNVLLTRLPNVENSFSIVCTDGAKLSIYNDINTIYKVDEVVSGDVTTYKFIRYFSVYDFENSTAGFGGFNSSFGASFNSSISSKDGNTYAVITNKPGVTSTTSATNAIVFLSPKSEMGDRVRDFDYFVTEFDISTGSNYHDGTRLAIFDNRNGAYNTVGYIVSNDGKWYLGDAKTFADSTKTIDLPGADEGWAHITLIAYADVSNGAYEIMTYVEGKHLKTTAVTKGVNAVDAKEFRMERLSVYFSASENISDFNLRIDNVITKTYGSKKTDAVAPYDSGDAFGIDDWWKLGDKTLPIYFLDDTFYNKDYVRTQPADMGISVNGVNYQNYVAAFAAAKNGDTVKINSDITLYRTFDSSVKTLNIIGGNVNLVGGAAKLYSYEGGVLTRNESYTLKIYLGDQFLYTVQNSLATKPVLSEIKLTGVKGDFSVDSAWNISVNGADYVLYDGFDWSTVKDGAEISLKPSVATVKWYQKDGVTLAAEEIWIAGDITSYDYAKLDKLPSLGDNGWYDIGYIGWDKLGSDDDALSVSAGEVASFAALSGYVSQIDAKINYNLGTRLSPAIYLPKAPANVKNIKVINNYSTLTSTPVVLSGSSMVIEGKEYTKYSAGSHVFYSWYPANYFTVSFDIELEDGATVSVKSKAIEVKFSNYASKILNSHSCGSVEHNLLINWVRFATEMYGLSNDQKNYETLTAADSLLTNHFTAHANCKAAIEALDVKVPESADETLTYRDVAAVVDGISINYLVASDAIRPCIYIPVKYMEGKDISVKISLTGIANGKTGQKIEAPLDIITTEIDGETVDEVYTLDGVDYYRFATGDKAIYVYNVSEIITVTVYDGDSVLASGTYSFAQYIYNVNASMPAEPTALQARRFAAMKAYANFAKASRAYMVYGTEAAN